MIFVDRSDAGRALAGALEQIPGLDGAIVLGLPRGGVPVAFEVARALNLPLDIFLVRKLGAPGQPELAMAALASDGTMVVNAKIVRQMGIPQQVIEAAALREKKEIERREELYRGGHPALPVEGKTIILVDDGLATGASMLAAARALRPRAAKIIIAVPVASEEPCRELRPEVDRVLCLHQPESFEAVGMFYRNFEQTAEEEVRDLLFRAAAHAERNSSGKRPDDRAFAEP